MAFGVRLDGPGLDQVAQDLAHEERVAVGLAGDGMGEPDRSIVESVSGSGFHEGHHSGVVQPDQVDPRDPFVAPQAASASTRAAALGSSLSR